MNRAKIQLDPDTEARLHGVRRQLWWGGLQGLVVGCGVGVLGHSLAEKFNLTLPKKLTRSTLLATVLLTGSLGSFIGAATYGKNAVQYIGDVFRKNSNPTSTYQTQLIKNEQSLINSFDESYRNREEAIRKSIQAREAK